MMQPYIFQFIDYRRLLKEFYAFQKESLEKFSFEMWSSELGLNHRSFLQNIINGRKKLPQELVQPLIDSMCLSTSEARYFELIVAWSNTKDDMKRSEYWDEILASSKLNTGMDATVISGLLGDWKIPIIKEIILCLQDISVDSIIQYCFFKLKNEEVESSIEFILDHKLVYLENGVWCDGLKVLRVNKNSPIESHLLKQYQKKQIEISIDALETIPINSRNIMTSTFSVNEATYREIELKSKEIFDLIINQQQDLDNPVVGQLNVQLFKIGSTE